jgi:signal transduction histidine kinase/ActR/RegA family two-component response regulator
MKENIMPEASLSGLSPDNAQTLTTPFSEQRVTTLFNAHLDRIHQRTDRMFSCLMLLQWAAALAAALWLSPHTWSGTTAQTHMRVWTALFLGGAITLYPVFLAWRQPGAVLTRHVIAVGQLLMSSLLIYLTGGRLETHFHVFGSLAFLAFYRDWRVLVTGTVVTALDHLLRGLLFPQSLYGIEAVEMWRWVEHVGWVIFEDTYLILACRWGLQELCGICERDARLEANNMELEQKVEMRTALLQEANSNLRSAHAELETRVGERTAELQRAVEEADRANHAKSEFLSRMSHELRTPLNAILGFGQILDKQPLTPLQEESVQYILKGGRHLLDLINEILDLARVEAGHIELSLEPIALAEIICESCALVRPLAAERTISLDSGAATFGGSHVLADRQRLKQALINLLSNAIKYNRSGGQVRVYCFPRPDNRLCIAVQDTGMGMTPEEQQRLFIPFERLDAARSGVEGTGLGLALAHRLVTAMGGSLTLESLPGEGTTFFLELPLVSSPEEILEGQLIRIGALEADISSEQRATILYIEDNLSNMRLLEILLRSRPGITLLTAMQGSIGLDLARQHAPDLILLDLNLPDISGREVLARLQASALTRDIPVIILSADATASQIERLHSAGARAYLTKPLDVSEFLHTLDTVLPDNSLKGSPGEELTI